MHYISENIKRLMDETSTSISELSKYIGVDKSTVSRWFSTDVEPKGSAVKKVAEFFDVEMDELYSDSRIENLEHRLKKPVQIPVYDVAAGQGRVNDAPTEHIHAEHSDEYSYIRIHGDSMLPELRDGDLVKVHHVSNDVTPNDFSVVKVDGETATIKFVEFSDGGMWLRASNKEVFEDTFYDARQIATYPVKVVGKAVAIVERTL